MLLSFHHKPEPPPTILHHLEDPFNAGDIYVPLLVHEAVSLNPLWKPPKLPEIRQGY
jgi:hypothetical protein